MFKKFYMLMEKEDSFTGGGDGANEPDTRESDNNGDGNISSDNPNPDETIGKNTFYEGIDPELYNDPSLKMFKDDKGNINGKNLIKSYIHTKKLVGRDKIPVPNQYSTEDEWKEVYRRLGLPETEDQYNLKAEENTVLGEEFIDKFKKKSYEIGVLPQQAQKMLDWYEGITKEVYGNLDEKYAETQNELKAGLREKWGKDYDRNFELARNVYNTISDENLTKSIEDTGLAENPLVIEMLSKLGNYMAKEGTFIEGNNVPDSVETVEENIRELMSHKAYWDDLHPNHDKIVKQVNKLFAKV